LSESSFTCPGLRASGLAQRLLSVHPFTYTETIVRYHRYYRHDTKYVVFIFTGTRVLIFVIYILSVRLLNLIFTDHKYSIAPLHSLATRLAVIWNMSKHSDLLTFVWSRKDTT